MADKVLMKGNEALAEAAIRSGCIHFFGYPITPQTELSAYMSKKLPKIGGVFLQAESEIAAANMVLGAASAGVRVMTSSSSPGISLKTEAISYLAGSDMPCVLINVQRGGPGLGGIQPSQADYFQATKAPGHGDLHIMVFAPSTIQEMIDTIAKAFEKADEYRVPAMILIDGMLGQMMEPVSFENTDVKTFEKPWATNGCDGSRERNITNSLFIQAETLEERILERFERYQKIKDNETEIELLDTDDADYVIAAYGATARIASTAAKICRDKGIKVGVARPITLWPFPEKAISQIAMNVKGILTVEMSMGQMVEDVRLAVNGVCPVEFYGRTGGVIPSPDEIVEAIEKMAGGAV